MRIMGGSPLLRCTSEAPDCMAKVSSAVTSIGAPYSERKDRRLPTKVYSCGEPSATSAQQIIVGGREACWVSCALQLFADGYHIRTVRNCSGTGMSAQR